MGLTLDPRRPGRVGDADDLRPTFDAQRVEGPIHGGGHRLGRIGIDDDDPVGQRALRLYRCLLCRRSEEHTSELQSLMRISYAVFCLKKTKKTIQNTT